MCELYTRAIHGHAGLSVNPRIVLDEVETKSPEGTGYTMLFEGRGELC